MTLMILFEYPFLPFIFIFVGQNLLKRDSLEKKPLCNTYIIFSGTKVPKKEENRDPFLFDCSIFLFWMTNPLFLRCAMHSLHDRNVL